MAYCFNYFYNRHIYLLMYDIIVTIIMIHSSSYYIITLLFLKNINFTYNKLKITIVNYINILL